MSFPTNTLPEEFQEEHGSIDLTDDKPGIANGQDDDGEDEDLDLTRAGQRVWLCKVSTPRLLQRRQLHVRSRSRSSLWLFSREGREQLQSIESAFISRYRSSGTAKELPYTFGAQLPRQRVEILEEPGDDVPRHHHHRH